MPDPVTLRLANLANPKGLRYNDGSAESDRLTQRLIAQAGDKTDILALSDPACPGFTQAAIDQKAQISLSTMPVQNAPINMMRATCRMPCSPAHFLRYLDVTERRSWDDNLKFGKIVADLIREETPDAVAKSSPPPSSTSSGEPRSKMPAAKGELQTNDAHTKDMSRRSTSGGVSVETPKAKRTVVGFKHMAFLSPLPSVVRNRDFELLVHEEVFADGTAVLKAFSTPLEFLAPPPAKSERQVRGGILLSGFVARPVAGGTECQVTYIALIQPMGRIPPMLVNLVIGKQTSTLRTLQEYIRRHPFRDDGDAAVVPSTTPLKAKL